MNYIEAHKIVHDFVDVVAKTKTDTVPAKRISELKNSKKEISDAFYVFFGHMYLYNTRTQEEHDNYKAVRFDLPAFVEDELIDEYLKCEKIINDKGIFARLRNRECIPYVKEKREQILKQMLSGIADLEEYKKVCKCFADIHDVAIEAREKIQKTNNGAEMRREIEKYCRNICEIAGVTKNCDDAEYFWPFECLKKLAVDPNCTKLYSKYKYYILNNGWD